MARAVRIEYGGAFYHVMARGNRRERIFRDEADRLLFYRTLGEACERTGWRVHAWVLMSNHYHLMVETPEANLVVGMRWLQNTYTRRHDCRHRPFTDRHLFYPEAAIAPTVTCYGAAAAQPTTCPTLLMP